MTEFENKVYIAVRTIPKGEVRTYKDIAIMIGSPNSARAIGNALHRNPDPDNTPCFRVVNSKLKLTKNFAFGGIDEQKRRLIEDGTTVIDDTVILKNHNIKAPTK